MPGQLDISEEQHGDVEQVASLHLRVFAHVALYEPKAASLKDGQQRVSHLVAEMAVGLAQQYEGRGSGTAHRDVARLRQGAAIGRRRRARRPAPRTTRTIVSWTTRLVRSGWMPIQGTSGKETGRGVR